MQATRTELRAGSVLTITSDAVSTGSVRRLAPSGSQTQYAATSISASATTLVGPFSTDRQYEVLTAVGELTYAISDGEPTATSSGLASSLSDETGTGAVVFGTSPTITTPAIVSPTITGTMTFDSASGMCSNLTTIASVRTITVPANSQALIFDTLTVAGSLTVAGVVRVTA